MNIKNKNALSGSELMPQGVLERQVLKERAALLAIPLTHEIKIGQLNQYVCFKLGKQESYGVPFQYIKEVILYKEPTKVPHTPSWIAGIMNWQGMLLTVLNLKELFHIQSPDEGRKPQVLVLHTQGLSLAIQADRIEGSTAYDPTTLDAPLAIEGAIKQQYITGLHQGTIAILNIEALISELKLNGIKM